MALIFPSTPTPGQIYVGPNGITYTWDNAVGVWSASSGSLSPASLAEAAAGTITNKYSSPQTAVPKDTSGMAGAALLPSGGNYTGTTTGMFRFNTTSNHVEFYDGASWQTSVNRSGDTMTGTLTIGSSGRLVLNTTVGVGVQCVDLLCNGNNQSSQFLLKSADSDGCGMRTSATASGAPAFFMLQAGPSNPFGVSGRGYLGFESLGKLFEFNTNGDFYIGGAGFNPGGGSWISTSDARLKKDIVECPYGLKDLKKLRPVQYTWNIGDKLGGPAPHCDGTTTVGLIAQEVLETPLEFIISQGPDDEYYRIDASTLPFILIKAIQELKAEFDEYKASRP
jgi:hypothetical protein